MTDDQYIPEQRLSPGGPVHGGFVVKSEQDIDWTSLVSTLLVASAHATPNAVVQHQFTRMSVNMRLAGEGERAIAVALLNALSDGLKYGNWPSNWPRARDVC